jgi:glucokinase
VNRPEPRRALVEICIDDLDGALTAERAGADRVELCADLLEGGTTPSHGLIETVLASVATVAVQIMVRPRGGDFVVSATEREVMRADLRAIARLAAGARVPVGVVLGVLRPDGRIDEAALADLIVSADGLPVTFHKAFDETPDPIEAYAVLTRLGVARVLTSGGAETAQAGHAVLAELVRRSRSDGAPTILAGGSVRAANVGALIDGTGVSEIHLRAQTSTGGSRLVTDEAVVAETVDAARSAIRTRVPAEVGAPPQAVLALDIGGTTLKAAIVDHCGVAGATEGVPIGRSGEDSLERVRALLLSLRSRALAEGRDVVGAGVGAPGLIDPATGAVRYASSLDWTDIPLGRILRDDLQVPVEVGHDVRTAGLAESLFGASAGDDDSLFVAIGTGVAAAVVSRGRVVDGHLSSAGELGHIPVVPDGELCTCGQRGCLEVYFSGAGLVRRYRHRSTDPSLALDAADIVRRTDRDPLAAEIWREGLDALATGLATATLLLDPRIVVLGGGVSRSEDALLIPLRRRLSESLAWREPPTVTTSMLGALGGRIGAAVLAFDAAGLGGIARRWRRQDVLAHGGPPVS